MHLNRLYRRGIVLKEKKARKAILILKENTVSDNMPNKYYWTREEKAKLVELWKKGETDPAVF